jgi:hypothetical protein
MKSVHSSFRAVALLGAALLIVRPHTAAAIVLDTIVAPTYQVGTTAGVSLGHAVSARTNYNRITAGGSYNASCAEAAMSPATGARTLSAERLTGPVSLVTTIPYNVPTVVNMPGFNLLAPGTVVSCVYAWTSKATESAYTVGIGGGGFQTGSGERVDGGSQTFMMIVPAASDDSDTSNACIP